MINISLLQEKVWEVVDGLTTAPVIQVEQEGYEPSENFVVTKLRDWTQIGSSEQRHNGGTSALYTVKSIWKVTLRLTSVGVDSNQLLLEIAHKFNKTTTKNLFKGIDLVYSDMGHVVDAPKKVNTGWEQRYVLDVYFHTVIEDTDELGYFEFVDLTVEAENEAGATVYTENKIVDIIP